MEKLYDIIIIGAGPSGLSCALYAKRANLNILIIEKETPGGQLININKIHNYPGYDEEDGASLAYKMYKQVTDLNVEFAFDEVINIIVNDDIKIVETLSNRYNCKNVVVATGTTYARLNVLNEKKYIGKGISYCAVCDGKFFQDKEIACLVNNEHSLNEVMYLLKFASYINLLALTDIKKFKLYDEIINTNKVTVINIKKISKLYGDDTLTSIDILKENDETINIKTNGLFVLTSSLPSNTFLSKYDIFTSNGYMSVNSNYESKINGIFGIGDVINKELRQVITACADGAIVAQYIANKRK